MSDYFTTDELACKHCGRMELDPDFIRHLNTLRMACGFAFNLSSAYRCPEHNQAVSRTGPNGPHTKGAVDVLVSGQRALKLVSLAATYGWTGIGISQKGPHASRFIHIDRLPDALGQPRPWIWSY